MSELSDALHKQLEDQADMILGRLILNQIGDGAENVDLDAVALARDGIALALETPLEQPHK